MMMLEKLLQPYRAMVAKKLIKRSSCDLCKQTLASQEVDLENDSYLKLLSLGGLFVPSRQLILLLVALLFQISSKRKQFLSPIFHAICTTIGVLNLHQRQLLIDFFITSKKKKSKNLFRKETVKYICALIMYKQCFFIPFYLVVNCFFIYQ